ncbi:hypothetical protein MY3296_009301 [Beauveria thailandica]
MGKLGSAHLIKHVAEAGEADAMICGDAGSLIIVRTGEKGRLWLEVEAMFTEAATQLTGYWQHFRNSRFGL